MCAGLVAIVIEVVIEECNYSPQPVVVGILQEGSVLQANGVYTVGYVRQLDDFAVAVFYDKFVEI